MPEECLQRSNIRRSPERTHPAIRSHLCCRIAACAFVDCSCSSAANSQHDRELAPVLRVCETNIRELAMGLMDVLRGMQNGPHGQPTPGSSSGMSPITMAILGYLAYKGIKHLSSSSSSNSTGSAVPSSSGGLGGLLSGGLGGLLSGGIGNLVANGTAGPAVSSGLGALLQQFQQNGQADKANSWVGAGPNKDISEQDLAKSLGEDDVNSLSQQTGMSRDDLLSALRRELPNVIDQLTPQGRIPAPHELSQQV